MHEPATGRQMIRCRGCQCEVVKANVRSLPSALYYETDDGCDVASFLL